MTALIVRSSVLAAFLVLGAAAQIIEPLRIVTRTLPVGTAGQEYSVTLSAAGGRTPYRWILINGSASLSSSGELSVSTSRTTGFRSNVVVQVRDADNRASTTTLLLVVNAKPEIVPATLQPITTGVPAQITFRVEGGTDPQAPVRTRGAFPPGLTLQNGTLGGTPTRAGTYEFTLVSGDANGALAVREYTLEVFDPLKITTVTFPSGSVGSLYSFSLKATGGVGPIRWSVSSGTRPTWLSLSQDGFLRGTPSAAGNFGFIVAATDAGRPGSAPATQVVSISVGGLLTIATMSPLPAGRQGQLYAATLRASGGVAPLVWSTTSGELPEGMTLSASGELRGVPSKSGVFGFGARVTDASGRAASRPYSVTITPAEDTVKADLVPDFVRFEVVEQGPPDVKSIQVVSSSRQSAEYTAMVEYFGRGNGWLNVPKSMTASAGTTGFLRLEANPINLAPGTYQARVLVQGPGLDSAVLPVSMIVSRGTRTMSVTPKGVTFIATEGGPAPPPKTISVLNGGVGSLVWNATATTISGTPTWLSIRNQTGSSETGRVPGVISLAANPAGLPAGDYYGVVNVESSMIPGGTQAMTVVMQVRPADSPVEVDVEPLGLVLMNQPQEIRLTNTGREPVVFYASPGVADGSHGYEFSPSTGELQPGVPFPVTVRVNQSIGFGVRRSLLNFAFSNDQSKSVDISVVSAAPGTSPAAASSALRTMAAVVFAACTPTQLVPVSTLFGSNFNVPAGWPTPIAVRVVNDCGAPMNAGTVTVAFSNGDPPLSLTPLGEGLWSGTWTGRNAITPQVTITITAEESSTGLKGSYQTTGGVQANPDPPVVSHGGIVNAASFGSRSPLAPGTLVTIFGSRLATAPITANSMPLDTTLGVTTVALGGRLLPLLYAEDGQVNAVVPFDVPLDIPQGLLIRRGTSLSVPETVVVTDAQPGVFTKDRSGRGQGLVVDANSRLVEAGNAARGGQSVAIFATGLGAVNPNVNAADAAPANPLASARGSVRVTIGGRSAEVLWAGLAPGFTGLYQVNVVVPPGTPSGDNVPVVVSTDDTVSPPVSIAVQQ